MKSKMLAYLGNGLCVLPADKKIKMTTLTKWKKYQTELPRKKDVAQWFHTADGCCLITGKASNNLEMIDFDQKAVLYKSWAKVVNKEFPGLLDTIPRESTQSGGKHLFYRTESETPGNTKLAQELIDREPTKDNPNDKELITYIETRGEGGLFLCYPTDGYILENGSFDSIPVLPQATRDGLIAIAQSFNKYEKPKREYKKSGEEKEGFPGSEFNKKADFKEILIEEGWTFVKHGEDGEQLSRPGKTHGTSAILHDNSFLYVFSTNAYPLESGETYSPFTYLAALEYEGDLSATSKYLYTKGFGKRSTEIKREEEALEDRSDDLVEEEPYVPVDAPDFIKRPPTDMHIFRMLRDSPLGKIVDVFRDQMLPELSMRMALPQALALVSACLIRDNAPPPTKSAEDLKLEEAVKSGDGKGDITEPELSPPTDFGVKRLALYLSGGKRKSPTNLYLLMVAPSTAGKSIGNIIKNSARLMGLKTTGSGSGEGTLDFLINHGNAIIHIDEFEPIMNKNHYKNSIVPILNSLFTDGYFDVPLSTRTSSKERKSDFAFPTIIAATQPKVIESICGKGNVDNGFLGRFLITYIDKIPNTTPNRNVTLDEDDVVPYLKIYRALSGPVVTPNEIADKIDKIITDAHPFLNEGDKASLRRTIPQYVGRLAVCISATTNPSIEDWDRAITMALWFWHQACHIMSMSGIVQDRQGEVLESLKDKIKDSIQKIENKNDKEKPATLSNIKRRNSIQRKWSVVQARSALDELVQDGEVRRYTKNKDGGKNVAIYSVQP